ncbi:MAG: hypothetical protein HYS27_12530 [Deltaproteobacteria bacterium]|nr:hypothetical protein [Deltaproteobacteria bacterium]
MNGPDDIRRALGRLALVLAVLGFGSVALGVGLAVLGLLGGAVMLFGSGGAGGAVGLSALCVVVGVVLAAGGVPELLAWYGISKRAPWGRWLGIVLCTTMLAAFPIGTAFGAWGLWVLLSSAGVRAFGQERSWLGDGAALAVGWFFMPDRDDDRCYRVDRRGRRHRRGRHGGRGGLLLLLLILGFFAFATCGSCWQSFAAGVSSGAAPSTGTGSTPDSSGMSFGAPETLGAQAGTWLRERGVLEAASGGAPPAPIGVQPPRDGSGDASTSTGTEPKPAERPAPPPPAPSAPATGTKGTGQLWIFEDAQGETHIVDDVEKIPERLRAKARPFK